MAFVTKYRINQVVHRCFLLISMRKEQNDRKDNQERKDYSLTEDKKVEKAEPPELFLEPAANMADDVLKYKRGRFFKIHPTFSSKHPLFFSEHRTFLFFHLSGPTKWKDKFNITK